MARASIPQKSGADLFLAMGRKRMTTEEVAALWGISQGTLANWRSLGTGPKFIRIGRRIRYRISALVAYERKNGAKR